MSGKYTFIACILFAVLLVLIFGLVFNVQNIKNKSITTGQATTFNATTTATIAAFFAINASANLSDGIKFTITTLPSSHNNASANYLNATGVGGQTFDSNFTFYFLTLEVDSNTNVDFCVKANDSLRSGANFINISNYTFSNATLTNITYPEIARQRTFNLTFQPTSINVATNGKDFYRFWLNVSGGQAAGTYTNAINFKSVQTGNVC